MLNWDDLKFFLAVCREGSVRAAGERLGVNHATVSRRISAFEKSLGQRLFERGNKGYARTQLGEEIYNEASYLEDRLSAVERLAIGKDEKLSGDIRVTLPDIMAQDLLMPAIADFCREYPDVEMEIVDSIKLLNLANREADVAFRVSNKPPEYLIGRKLAVIHRACYLPKNLAKELNQEELRAANWIGWTDKLRRPVGKIAKEYPRFNSRHKIANALLQAEACKNGMGVSILPCFIGDSDPDLVRIPPYTSEPKFDFWVLNHPDLRNNAKVMTFVRFMAKSLEQQKDLIEGRRFTAPEKSL